MFDMIPDHIFWPAWAAAMTFTCLALAVALVKMVRHRRQMARDKLADRRRAIAREYDEGPHALTSAALDPYSQGWPTGRAADWIANQPTVSRANLAEKLAVSNPDLDLCEACGRTIGSSNTTYGVKFEQCRDTRAGTLCTRYRSTEIITHKMITSAPAAAAQAARALTWDKPEAGSTDPEISDAYRHQMDHMPWLLPQIGQGDYAPPPRKSCVYVYNGCPHPDYCKGAECKGKPRL